MEMAFLGWWSGSRHSSWVDRSSRNALTWASCSGGAGYSASTCSGTLAALTRKDRPSCVRLIRRRRSSLSLHLRVMKPACSNRRSRGVRVPLSRCSRAPMSLTPTPQDEHDEVLGVGEIDALKQWPIGARHCPAGPIQGEAELMIKVEGRVAHVPRVSRIGDCAQFSCALRCWYGHEPQVVSQLHHASQEAP